MDAGGSDEARDCQVVTARGELDLATAWAFGIDLRGRPGRTGNAFLVVDLNLVTFMDCAALRELCGAARRREALGGWVRLVYGQPTIHRLLTAAHLSGPFPRHATVADARCGVVALPPNRFPHGPDMPDRTPDGSFPLAS